MCNILKSTIHKCKYTSDALLINQLRSFHGLSHTDKDNDNDLKLVLKESLRTYFKQD